MERSEKAATLGSGPQQGDPESAPAIVSVPAKRQHLFLPSTQLQTHIHSRTPLIKDCSQHSRRGLETRSAAAFKLSAATWAPRRPPRSRDGEVATNFPGRSPLRLPTSRAGGGAEEGGDGPGKDAELAGDATGHRFHSPSLLRPAPFWQPGSEAHRKLSPFPRLRPSVFATPPS